MRTRCGVNTGSIVTHTGVVGARDSLRYTAHGDDVNIAARLEQINKKYGTYILATERTVRAIGGGFVCKRMDELAARGRVAPTVICTLEQQGHAMSRRCGPPPGMDSFSWARKRPGQQAVRA